jgi:hypothetical protein
VKVGRRLITVPGVTSMTNSNPTAPATKPGHSELEKTTMSGIGTG